MEQVTVLSLFPQIISSVLSYGILKKAMKNITINLLDLRKWGIGVYRKVDSPSVAPGPGMLFRPDVLSNALRTLSESGTIHVVHTSPRGVPLTNIKALELSQKKHLVIIASRYEGLDQRVIDRYVDEEISIGDYIISGGELASLVLIDAVFRMTGDVLRMDAVADESFQQGLLEYSHYTKPLIFEKCMVPEILRSGNHRLIGEYRFIEQLFITWLNRSDLFRDYPLCDILIEHNNPLKKIRKKNMLLKKRLNAFEKAIWEYKHVRRT